MAELTATGERTVISEGFVAFGDTNQSDGMGPRYEIGRFATLEGAIAAARGKGVQGDPGTVSSFGIVSYAGGLTRAEETPLIERRRTPEGSYLVGFLDLREYEFGVRPAGTVPVRPADSSIWGGNSFAVLESEARSLATVFPSVLRQMLTDDAESELVGAWRRVGELGWRGEFPSGTDRELDRWLPRKGY